MRTNVFLHPTSDEESEGNGRVSFEEGEHTADKIHDPLLVLAFVESVNDDKERPFDEDKSLVQSSLKRFVNQPLQLHSQGGALGEQA